MKQLFLILFTLIMSLSGFAQTWIKTDNATVFKILSKNEKGRKIVPEMILLADLYGIGKKASDKQDTVIYNSVSSDKPFYIPTEQPGLQNVFYQLNEGDSIVIKVIADTFFNKTFSSPLPSYIDSGSIVTLYFHIQEALTKSEIEQKAATQNKALVKADSLLVLNYCIKNKGFKKLATGLRIKKLVSNDTATQAKKGDMLSVFYKGWIINGDIFDENLRNEPFKFVLGMKQVIPGWEQALSKMKKGEKCRIVIPWYLAYGSYGNGPIPPFTSIVFDVQIVDIK